MCEEWVEAVWEASQTKNIKATDKDLLEKYKLPAFDKLCICTTGLDETERTEIKSLIETHGGTFTGKMSCTKTHMLVCKS